MFDRVLNTPVHALDLEFCPNVLYVEWRGKDLLEKESITLCIRKFNT